MRIDRRILAGSRLTSAQCRSSGTTADRYPSTGGVRMSNEAVRRVGRHVDYVHMPVVPWPDHAFLAPLQNLDIGDTKVFLGIVHHTDTIDDFRRRRDLACKNLPEFGIGSVCGYGRVDPQEAHDVLDPHADNAAEL